MSRVANKHGRDQELEFQGFLNDLQDWEISVKDKDKRMRPHATDKGKSVSSSQKIGIVGDDRRPEGPTVLRTDAGQYSYTQKYDSVSRITSILTNEESIPDAASEKELGNDYFKQKKFKEAVECYARSIALAPTAVAYANRAMTYLKLRRFQGAEDDCTEALNLDDRYIKAYSRRATARKELGKYKESSEDAEFAMRLEPQNQELKKQYAEVKSLYQKELFQRASGALRSSTQDEETSKKSNLKVNGIQEVSSVPHSSQETAETSIQEDQTKVTSSQKIGIAGDDRRPAGPTVSRTDAGQYGYTHKYDSISRITSTLSNEESTPDAVSEKELGNDCFKQKKFKEAIECYSRSIALAPTAVAYANRAMTYLKLRRFQAAEDDCTEALNLDDRYIKAYSRRATSRKELGKYKESSEDAEFAMRLEPQNQEIKKQYAEVKSLYQKELFQRASEALRSSTQEDETLEKSNLKVNGIQDVSSVPHSSQGTAETFIQEDQTKVSSSQKIGIVGDDRKSASPTVSRTDGGQYDSISRITSTITNEESIPDAVSEKELGNEYFKQKKFKEAIECYSRSIALAPTAVAYTNRAMACLKLRRFQAAEDDCTEALNFDDRYIKAYSRRATARKELGKYKGSSEDAEFAMRLEPQNQEIKKQYAEVKSLYQKELLQRESVALGSSTLDEETTEKSNLKVNGVQEVSSVPHSSSETADMSIQENQTKEFHRSSKNELKPSVQELANRAAALALAEAAKNITPPTSAYQFEVSWRGLSGDHAQQARFLKAISPSALPQIFKNALSAPILIDIIKCLATFFNEEMDLTIKYLETLTRVSRFNMIIMCLSSSDKADLVKIWDEQFCGKAISTKYVEVFNELRARYRAQ